jgi:ribosomal protein L12E/L44/L45/RPP1/RPP2
MKEAEAAAAITRMENNSQRITDLFNEDGIEVDEALATTLARNSGSDFQRFIDEAAAAWVNLAGKGIN